MHGIFVIVLFIVLGYILSKADLDKKIDSDYRSDSQAKGFSRAKSGLSARLSTSWV